VEICLVLKIISTEVSQMLSYLPHLNHAGRDAFGIIFHVTDSGLKQ